MDGNGAPHTAEAQEPTIVEPFTHAVVMGDIVASEKTNSIKALYRDFNDVVERANAEFPGIVSPLTITLGDEFQGVMATFSDGVRIMRQIRASLLQSDVVCRFVVGLVRIETPINAERAWNMMGPGLAAARERLADKRDPNAYRFLLPDDRPMQELMDAVGASLSWIEGEWTDRQRQVVLSWARAESPERLAAELKHSVATLYKVRRAGNFDLYERQWRALEAAAGAVDARHGLR